ncbi:MAG TPA: SpoIID/LytB domain-containing protein [Solirubrobacteraceae bacterium]|nr:SpoIID/LytB domain-containing protein [Solirubrobacteraceae bacterium]
MRRLLITGLSAAAVLVPAGSASADYVIDGRGFGHGVGMSQYGAYGYAQQEGRDFRWILGHYYPGTTVGRVASARLRVVLRDTRVPKVCGATRARAAGGRTLRLRDTRTYAFSAYGAGKLRVVDTSSGRTRAKLPAPVRVTGGVSTCVRGEAINGVRNGSYRGAMRLHRWEGKRILAVNDLGLESYLQGVVTAEMPASWAAEALKAQAVVARSYALRNRRSDRVFDLYPDTRSQVYRGIAGETAAAIAAARGTRALAVRYGVEIAQTFFHSTSGGRTAGYVEGFGGGLGVPYLRPVDDAHDDISPVHTWQVRLSDRDMERKLKEVRLGALEDVKVTATGETGRVSQVAVVGDEGTIGISGQELRRLLELRSHWFTIRREPSRPTR